MYKITYQNQRIRDIYKEDRPREKMKRAGAESLSSTELLAILLGSGYKGTNVIQLSSAFVKKYDVKDWPKIKYKDLVREKGFGDAAVCRVLASIEMGRRIQMEEKAELPLINDPADIYEEVKYIGSYRKEHLIGLYLNARNQLIHKETISMGSLTEGIIHPREVFIPALLHHAASVVIAHNHPSDESSPSPADIKQSKKLEKAGEVMGIDMLDHLIITKKGFESLRETGQI